MVEVEAPDHHGMAPTSRSYISKMFETSPMLWMGCEIAIITPSATDRIRSYCYCSYSLYGRISVLTIRGSYIQVIHIQDV
jgi:hypothetical protein